ncbi:MAG: hypothetical protein R3B90_20320 [Planctomycetaceae bacterium]
MLSAAAWLKVHKRLPCNVKFVIEGEEEVGSNNLDDFTQVQRGAAARMSPSSATRPSTATASPPSRMASGDPRC